MFNRYFVVFLQVIELGYKSATGNAVTTVSYFVSLRPLYFFAVYFCSAGRPEIF